MTPLVAMQGEENDATIGGVLGVMTAPGVN